MGNDDIYQQVTADFKITGSVKKTAQNVGTTLVRAQRILITEGLWSSPTSEKVADLYVRGKTVSEIAEELLVSEKTVQAYLPYSRTEKGYGGEERTLDARKSGDYRKRMQIAADSQVSKDDMKKEREEMIEKIRDVKSIECEEQKATRKADDERIVGRTLKENISLFTAEELYTKHMQKQPEVLKLKMSLDMEYVDESDMEVLRKYGKVENGIMREILVPADITLHALNYAILRAFGWQNSHLHRFCFPKKVFQKLTGGKNKVDKYDYVEYDGNYKNWVNLCGLYFRYPTEDFEDIYWDDDYEEGQSIKTWFRKKYTGPYRYKGEWEHYRVANAAANRDMKENSLEKHSIQELLFGYQAGMDELLERIPLIELLIPMGIKEDSEIMDKIMFLQNRQQKEPNDISVLPVAYELIYSYDYGDGWDVRITLEDCYYTKDGFDAQKESGLEGGIIIPVTGKQVLADKTAFDMNNQKLGKAMTLKVATVTMKKKPVGLSVDGLNLMDDVGGIHGYIDFLRIIHGEDPDEKEDMKEWAKWMGWTGRMTKPEALL
ncbi:MAG: hypothetical protein E7222_09965 [Clostridiales bacterium]|nr:hypothetical protein [Clostridiales bacterium]